MNGYGIIYKENGSIRYKGQFRNNSKNGEGILYNCLYGATFYGNFINDLEDTLNGHFKWDDGSSYKGNVKFDTFHGQGIYTSKSGKVYSGNWNFGKLNEIIYTDLK